MHLIWGLRVGGSETMLVDISRKQAAAHDTWIVVGNDDVDDSIARSINGSVQLVRVRRPRGNVNPWHLARLIAQIRRIKPDIIHAHEESFASLRTAIRAPMILTLHSTRLALSSRLRTFKAVYAISEAVRADVLHRFPACNPSVIYNGIDFSSVKPKTSYGDGPFRIVQVGRLVHDIKGQDLTIRSLQNIRDRIPAVDVSVDFIGEGPSLAYLRRLAAECGVEHQCRFLGLMDRRSIYERLQEYDLLIQPSRYEGFGLSIVEGIAAGLPVLVSDIEGPTEIIGNEQLGWRFRTENSLDLASNVIGLMTASRRPGFAEEMRDRMERARSRFDIGLTAQRYLEEYNKLC